MTAGTILAALAGIAAIAFVLAPLFRKDAAEAERVASALSEAQELQSQREMALAAIKDLDEDRATGKIGDADYAEMKAKLQARAIDILKRLDAKGSSLDHAPLRPVPKEGVKS